jgi:hypothetical protein
MSLSFRPIGRSRMPVVDGPGDLAGVLDLEDALWIATAAPIDTLRGDPGFLAAVDADGDGRIRSDELRATIRRVLDALGDTSVLAGGRTQLSLSALRAEGEGARLRSAAEHALRLAGAVDAREISLAQVRAVRASEEARGLSAAGLVLPGAAGDDAALAAFLAHVVEATGGTPHPSGGPAVSPGDLDRFLAEGAAWLAWHDRGFGSDDTPTLRPLGDATQGAAEAVDAILDKLDQYWLLCDAVALDPRLADAARVDAGGADLLDPAQATTLLRRAPLAAPAASGVLDLDGPLNPAWRAELDRFAAAALDPLLGGVRQLDRDAIARLQGLLAPWRGWRRDRPADGVACRPRDIVDAHVSATSLHARVRALLSESEAAAATLADLKDVERLLLCVQGLLPLVRSFVTMPDLYAQDGRALFERGRLVMDGRVFDLAVRVNDLPGPSGSARGARCT